MLMLLISASFQADRVEPSRDRKSTRLNSSHLGISYAVFCLKKKKELSALKWHRKRMSCRHRSICAPILPLARLRVIHMVTCMLHSMTNSSAPWSSWHYSYRQHSAVLAAIVTHSTSSHISHLI